MEEKIINFNQDDKFYFKKGNEFLANGEVLKAISYFNKAIKSVKPDNTFLKCSYYLVLAQSYSLIKWFEISNFYYYKALENDVFAQLVFRGLGENFYNLNDKLLSRFYLNQCVMLLENSQVAMSAKTKLDELDLEAKKFRVIKNEDCYLTSEEQYKVGSYISKGKFDSVVTFLEEKNQFSDPKIRAELCLAYFFTEEIDKGIELLNTYGKETINDLCNMLLFIFSKLQNKRDNIFINEGDILLKNKKNNILTDKEDDFFENKTKNLSKNENDCIVFDDLSLKFNEIKEKILNYKIEDEELYFKIGLTFAQVELYDLARQYMEQFFEKNVGEPELKFLYALICLNCENKAKAKNILIDLKLLDSFNSYVYNYYLKICDDESFRNFKFQYVFGVPVAHYIKIQSQLKDLLNAPDEQILDFFIKNEDLFYFLVRQEDNLIKNILIKLSKFDNEKLNAFFEYILLEDYQKINIKNKIILNRLKLDSIANISFTRNKIFTKIVVPNMQITRLNNQSLFDALQLTLKFLVEETMIMNINLKREVIKLEKILKDKNLDCNILACFMVWDYLKDRKIASINKICKYFCVLQSDLYDFVEKFNLGF